MATKSDPLVHHDARQLIWVAADPGEEAIDRARRDHVERDGFRFEPLNEGSADTHALLWTLDRWHNGEQSFCMEPVEIALELVALRSDQVGPPAIARAHREDGIDGEWCGPLDDVAFAREPVVKRGDDMTRGPPGGLSEES